MGERGLRPTGTDGQDGTVQTHGGGLRWTWEGEQDGTVQTHGGGLRWTWEGEAPLKTNKSTYMIIVLAIMLTMPAMATMLIVLMRLIFTLTNHIDVKTTCFV